MSENQSRDKLNNEFDWFQKEEEKLCLEHGIDAALLKRFMRPEVSFRIMREIRKGLEVGIDLTDKINLKADLLRELRKGWISGVDLEPYIEAGYQADQIREIRHALEKKIDLGDYINIEFAGLSIKEIAIGLEHGIDVSVYANIDYSPAKMREIRLGIEHHVDYEIYLNKLFSAEQMREIRLGLEDGLPVEEYRSFLYTAAEMEKKRLRLAGEAVMPRAYRASRVKTSINMRGAHAWITDDGFSAMVEIGPDFAPGRKADFVRWLKENNIYSGIDDKLLDEILGPNVRPGKYVIARGRRPQKGDDGYYEYFIDLEAARKNKDFKANIENYKTARWFEAVKKGQRIALYHKAVDGTDGYYVNGQILNGIKGREEPVLIGEGIHAEKGNVVYFADYDGKIDMVGNEVNIIPMLELEGLNVNEEQIDFDGFVHVIGDVQSGSSIRASRGILVDGTAYNAKLESDEDIILRKGMTGDGRGSIKSEGNIVGCFFEEAYLRAAGNIYSDSCVNCDIYSSSEIHVDGKIGRIMGGNCYGSMMVSAQVLGNEMSVRTQVSTGVVENDTDRLKQLEEEVETIDKQVELLYGSYYKLLHDFNGLNEKQQELELRLENAMYEKLKDKEEKNAALYAMRDRIQSEKKAAIYAYKHVYENVTLEINGNHLVASESDGVKISGDRRIKSEVLHP